LWEKVARTKSAPDEGFLSAGNRPLTPSAMLRIASTLSHKGRGEEKPGDDELKTAVSASTNQFQE
jgi:hypothetical protein